MVSEAVEKFAELQESFYKCETSNEWSVDQYNQLLDLLGSDVKQVQVRSIALSAKYAKHFPDLIKDAFSRHLGLLASDDHTVKSEANKHLEGFLRPIIKEVDGAKVNVNPIILEGVPSLLEKKFAGTQDEANAAEAKLADEIIVKMLHADLKSVAIACSSTLQTEAASTNDVLREYLLKFFTKDVITDNKKTLSASSETELAIKDEIAKLLSFVGKSEFERLLKVLTGLKISSNKELFGHQGIVDTLSTLIDTTSEVDLTTLWQVERTLSIISGAVPYMSNGVVDKVFGPYLIEKWVAPEDVFSKATDEHKVNILQRVCEVVGNLPQENIEASLTALYPAAMRALPTRPAEGEEEGSLEFATIECFLYLLTQLGNKAKDTFTTLSGCKVMATENEAKSAAASEVKSKETLEAEKVLKDRMKYIHDKAVELQLQLTQARQKLQKAAASENKEPLLAQIRTNSATLDNVVALCKPLASQYSHFGANRRPSWKVSDQKKRPNKRPADGAADQPAKRQKQDHHGGKKGGKGRKGGKGGKRH